MYKIINKTNLIKYVGNRQISSATTTKVMNDEIQLLEQLLKKAKDRAANVEKPVKKEDDSVPSGPKFIVGTYNAISSDGLTRFPKKYYDVKPLAGAKGVDPHAIMLRSYKLKSDEVPASVRAIGRCGAGTNNIPVAEMTKRGIPVFNAPGANANAVKELALCALLLCSRGIIEGINHMKNDIIAKDGNDLEKVKKRVEAEKKHFVGMELKGKTLGVVGLGNIGASIAESAAALGMNVIGYDPQLSVEAAWKLPGSEMTRASKLDTLLQDSDYISLNVPYMPATHHLIGADQLKIMKPTAHLINFARGELVDGAALRASYDKGGRVGRYISDFPDEHVHDHPKVTLMPHLGASTEEAETNSAVMAADQIKKYIETGAIINAVNFPRTDIPAPAEDSVRICVVNRNVPGVLGLITSTVGSLGHNITGQVNTSLKDVAYTVLDLASVSQSEIDIMQSKLASLDGVVSSRVIEATKMYPSNYRVNQIK